MKELAIEIQKVMNTLEGLDIRSTYDNLNRLLGSLQVLASVRDALERKDEEHGNADSE